MKALILFLWKDYTNSFIILGFVVFQNMRTAGIRTGTYCMLDLNDRTLFLSSSLLTKEIALAVDVIP